MTLRRAIQLLPRPWINGDVTFKEWCLACDVLFDAAVNAEAQDEAIRRILVRLRELGYLGIEPDEAIRKCK